MKNKLKTERIWKSILIFISISTIILLFWVLMFAERVDELEVKVKAGIDFTSMVRLETTKKEVYEKYKSMDNITIGKYKSGIPITYELGKEKRISTNKDVIVDIYILPQEIDELKDISMKEAIKLANSTLPENLSFEVNHEELKLEVDKATNEVSNIFYKIQYRVIDSQEDLPEYYGVMVRLSEEGIKEIKSSRHRADYRIAYNGNNYIDIDLELINDMNALQTYFSKK